MLGGVGAGRLERATQGSPAAPPICSPSLPHSTQLPQLQGGAVLGTVTTKVLVREVEHGDYKGSMVGKGLFGVGEYDVSMMRKWV